MSANHGYQPPYTITPTILNLVAQISEAIGRLAVLADQAQMTHLNKPNSRLQMYRMTEKGRLCLLFRGE